MNTTSARIAILWSGLAALLAGACAELDDADYGQAEAALMPDIPLCSRCNITEGGSFALGATLDPLVAFGETDIFEWYSAQNDPEGEIIILAAVSQQASEAAVYALEMPSAAGATAEFYDANAEPICFYEAGTLFDVATGRALLEVEGGAVYEPRAETPSVTFSGTFVIEGDTPTGTPVLELSVATLLSSDARRAELAALVLGVCVAQ